MLKTNEASLDRVLRVVVGLGLLIWFFTGSGEGVLHYAKLVAGAVLVLTGAVGTCPIYSLFGISTCQMKRP
jgi:hypothetical protein